MRKSYSAPVVRTIGSLAELTQKNNKIGFSTDAFSSETGLVGSIVPAQPHN
jgi:hypothetical protein